jgi:hypothetical protein
MARDFTEYALQKQAEFRDTCSAPPVLEEYKEEAGSNGKRGEVYAQIELAEDAFLYVHEKVVRKLGGFTREVYCYALVIDEANAESWERDPIHSDEPIHAHTGPDRKRKPCEVVSFKEALEKAWNIVIERELAPWSA